MTTIQFYHLLSTSAERAVPKLMEKALSAGLRVVMLANHEARLKSMSDALWTADPNGFLPHGTAREGHAADQPIYLTLAEENPNAATVLCILDGAQPDHLPSFEKVLDVFDGSDAQATAAARRRWAAYKEAGHKLQYVKQQPNGSWKVEAEA